MASTLSPSIQAEFSKDARPTEPSRPVDFDLNHGQFSRTRPSLGKRASRTLAPFLITFCIGVAATLAWQFYGDTAREMIANSYPQLGWLAPQAAPLAQTAPNTVAPAAPAALSPEVPQLKAMAASLAAVRQSVDQLAAGQQQMVGDIANLRGRGRRPREGASTCRRPTRTSFTRSQRLRRGPPLPRRASPCRRRRRHRRRHRRCADGPDSDRRDHPRRRQSCVIANGQAVAYCLFRGRAARGKCR